MVERGGDDTRDAALRERIRSAVAETPERELVEVDFSGPQVTVVVGEFAREGEERRLVERSLYSVHEEPNLEIDAESGPAVDGDNLQWTYLGPVERTDEGWEQVEE